MAKGSTIRGGKLLAATTLMLGTLTTASYAYTPQQEQLCTGDAMRLCGEYIPDVDRITACMVSKHDQLQGCIPDAGVCRSSDRGDLPFSGKTFKAAQPHAQPEARLSSSSFSSATQLRPWRFIHDAKMNGSSFDCTGSDHDLISLFEHDLFGKPASILR